MNELKLKKYLECRGLTHYPKGEVVWSVEDLKRFVSEEDDSLFDGQYTGCLKFGKSVSGKRYIEFLPSRCYLD